MVEVLARESRNSTFLLRQASDADLATNSEWSLFLLQRAAGFDPDNPDVISKLGRTLRTLGHNEAALEYLRAYHDKVPGDLLGLAQLASCLTALGQYDESEPMLRQVLAGLDDALTHYNLGVVLSATNRATEAIAEYKKALERDPLLFDARNNLAVAYARQGKMAEAAAELRKVLAADPQNAMARANLQLIER
jgi:tetratricopeptide (TPR) repeat protein